MEKKLVLIKLVEIVAYIVMALGATCLIISPSLGELAVTLVSLAIVCVIDKRNGWGIWSKEYDYCDYRRSDEDDNT